MQWRAKGRVLVAALLVAAGTQACDFYQHSLVFEPITAVTVFVPQVRVGADAPVIATGKSDGSAPFMERPRHVTVTSSDTSVVKIVSVTWTSFSKPVAVVRGVAPGTAEITVDVGNFLTGATVATVVPSP